MCLEEHSVAHKSIKSSVHSVDARGTTARLEQLHGNNNKRKRKEEVRNCTQAAELILAHAPTLQSKIKGSLRLILTEVGKKRGWADVYGILIQNARPCTIILIIFSLNVCHGPSLFFLIPYDLK